jgi:hypothetical protein
MTVAILKLGATSTISIVEILDAIFGLLQPIDVKELKVAVTPNIVDAEPKNGTVIGRFGQKYLVVDSHDIKSIQSLARTAGTDKVSFQTFLDYYKNLGIKDCIVLDEYFGGEVLLTAIKEGEVVDFAVSAPAVAERYAKEMMHDHGISEVRSIVNIVKDIDFGVSNISNNLSGVGKVALLPYMSEGQVITSEVSKEKEHPKKIKEEISAARKETLSAVEIENKVVSKKELVTEKRTKPAVSIFEEGNDMRVEKWDKTLTILLKLFAVILIVSVVAVGAVYLYKLSQKEEAPVVEQWKEENTTYFENLYNFLHNRLEFYKGGESYEVSVYETVKSIEFEGYLLSLDISGGNHTAVIGVRYEQAFDKFKESLSNYYDILNIEWLEDVVYNEEFLTKVRITFK